MEARPRALYRGAVLTVFATLLQYLQLRSRSAKFEHLELSFYRYYDFWASRVVSMKLLDQVVEHMLESIGSITGRKSVGVVVNGVKRVGKGHMIRGRSSKHLYLLHR